MLAATGVVRTPEIIGVTGTPDDAVLVLAFVPTMAPTAAHWRQLGYALAELHRHTQATFGLDRDNFIGDFVQTNTPNASWNDFYVAWRLQPMLHRAVERGLLTATEVARLERLMQKIDDIAAGVAAPALLHGDLWKGNVLFAQDGPLLIDPAVSYGHREMDIAFTRMSSAPDFPSSFYEAYEDAHPLPADHADRQELWQLWPLLTHVVQDGRQVVPRLMHAVAKYE